MPSLKNNLSGLLLLLPFLAYTHAATAATTTASAWTSYVGSHYSTRSWAQSVRDPSGPGQVGFNAADPAGSLATFNNTLTHSITPLLPQYYQVLSVGGLGSGRDGAVGAPPPVSTFMNLIQSGSVATYRDALYQRAKAVALLSGAADKVYWQFGNEINSEIFSKNLHAWAGDNITPGKNDTTTIPWLVEYFIAPGAEGVMRASQELFADPSRIHIMLGSVSSAVNPNAQTFLRTLLDYQIVGSYAPSLAGKRVYDIVDTLSIHYAVGSAGSDWRVFLDGLYQNRVGQGSIRGVISTEEVGQSAAREGNGMGTAVQVLMRYLDWWLAHDIGPIQGHVFFFGSDLGATGTTTKIDQLMPTLHSFLGDVALSRPTSAATVTGATNLEHYQYESVSQRRRILSVFSSDTQDTTLSTITVDAAGWNNLTVTGHHYTSTGDQLVTPSVTLQANGKYLLTFAAPGRTIKSRDALVLFLQDNTSISSAADMPQPGWWWNSVRNLLDIPRRAA